MTADEPGVPRLPIRSASEQPVDFQFGKSSRATHLNGTLAHSPGLWQQVSGLARWFRVECSLPPRLRESVILLVGYEIPSAYVVAQHLRLAFDAGVSEQEVTVLREPAPKAQGGGRFDQRELAALAAAREILHDGRFSEPQWSDLMSHYSHAETVELCALIAFYEMTARLAEMWDLKVESAQADDLARFPPRARRAGESSRPSPA